MSPLLANIYMRRFLKAWELRGNERRFACRIVNYADDFVILCRHSAAAALAEGLVLLSCGVHANTIRILMPLTISDQLLAEGMAKLERALVSANG